MVRYESNGRLAVAEPVAAGLQVPKPFWRTPVYEVVLSLW